MTGPDPSTTPRPSRPETDPVDPRWAPPAERAELPRGRRPLWLLVGAPLVALALLIGLTAAFGGFGARKDRRHDVAVGAEITTGPFVFTITRATAQLVDSFGEPSYRVVVYGTVRNTGDDGMVPSTTQFYGRDLHDPAVQTCDLVSIGDNTDATIGNTVTPGLPAVILRLEFTFDRSWHPSGTFRIAIADLTEVSRTLGGQDPHLEPDADSVYRVDMPMKVLAAQTS